jgi:hypothetical protein
VNAGRALDILIHKAVFGVVADDISAPFYSTWISDAWLLVDEMRRRKWEWTLDVETTGRNWARLFQPRTPVDASPEFESEAEFMPLAICEATFQALGVEVPA